MQMNDILYDNTYDFEYDWVSVFMDHSTIYIYSKKQNKYV